ncbi:MAG: hypothetical protein ACI89X_002028 [Planctomycetota bacterium]|jgi:hypothetical protein
MLPALCIVNQCGQYVSPANICQYSRWMRRARSWNMAYMLSAQLVARHNNVLVGKVDANCVINDPCLGVMTIEQLIQQAIVSLCANPFTPPGRGPQRPPLGHPKGDSFEPARVTFTGAAGRFAFVGLFWPH